ncbi:MAG: hypothetical protein AUK47_17785 [Deltaproteobacteria bacterium CG2_30_63_29]|nr:MAG: hypothetical protein AUK47_17785 [Deltaproteobacteria bacterium CG2_30_63_29]
MDFTGGVDLRRSDLVDLGRILTDKLETRYGLPVRVSEPVKTEGRGSTWKLSVETRATHKHLPAQRIHLDLCAIPSHEPRPMMLRNIYGVELGTAGLILQAQSREEILADKLIALAFRESRGKNRDLWDIAWLTQQGVELPARLIPLKIRDHQRDTGDFEKLLRGRLADLKAKPEMRVDFIKETRRFLPAATVRGLETPDYWTYLTQVLDEQGIRALGA